MSRTPFLITGTALIFWGLLTGHLVIGGILAVVVELRHWVRLRWDMSSSDFSRFSDVSVLIFLGFTVYLLFTSRSILALFEVIQWLPPALSPILLSQFYSTKNRIPFGALLLISRRTRGRPPSISSWDIDLTYPFIAVCILSAATANIEGLWFYGGAAVICAWALWFQRSKRFSPVIWAGLLGCAAGLGYLGFIGLHNLQLYIEEKGYEWFSHMFEAERDPFRRFTSIGTITRLKGSDRIVLRVKPEALNSRPKLLRGASYNSYRKGSWFAVHSTFKLVKPDRTSKQWRLHSPKSQPAITAVTSDFKNGSGLLFLPLGTVWIDNLASVQMKRNQFGTLKIEKGPEIATYQIAYDNFTHLGSPPTDDDIIVPEDVKPALETVARQLQLNGQLPGAIIALIERYFASQFTYSLTLRMGGRTPVNDFLLRTKSGHCEYFATAAVLLLRYAGVSARYASGYSVQEFSRIEKQFIVRDRHAHAWALAFVNGRWVDFDPTPAAWPDIESEAAPFWQPIGDLVSWLSLKFRLWRSGDDDGGINNMLLWLLIPLVLILIKRLYSGDKMKTIRLSKAKDAESIIVETEESPFYAIETHLIRLGHHRPDHLPIRQWLVSYLATTGLKDCGKDLESIVDLHYRLRFDPKGLTVAERDGLQKRVEQWLEKQRQDPNMTQPRQ